MRLRCRQVGLIGAAAILASSCGFMRSAAAPHDARAEPVYTYLAAFNRGDPAALAAALEEIYAPAFLAGFGGATAAAWERLELFRTYGVLAVIFVDSLANPPIVWTRGRVSRGWVGHQFYIPENDGKVVRHTVWRARPVPYPPRRIAPGQVADSMRQYLHDMASARLFSGSVQLSRGGSEVLSVSSGGDGRTPASAVAANTRFHIASVTKLLTATAALQLIQAGTIQLDDAVGRWIPEYPAPYRDDVRVRHLLTHTSGIELDDLPEYLAEIRVARSAADLLQAQIKHLAGREVRFEAGTEYDYSSEAIDLLAVIMERASGRSWTELVRDSVLVTAGMSETRFAVPANEPAWALGKTSLAGDLQTTNPGTLRSALEVLPVVAKPSSGIWSTAADLHRFMRAVLERRLLSSAWTDSLLTPKFEAGEFSKYGIRTWTGLGAQGEDLWGTRTVGHGGVVPGYSAAIEYLPASDWLLTVVSNTGEATAFLVFQRFLELVASAHPD